MNIQVILKVLAYEYRCFYIKYIIIGDLLDRIIDHITYTIYRITLYMVSTRNILLIAYQINLIEARSIVIYPPVMLGKVNSEPLWRSRVR